MENIFANMLNISLIASVMVLGVILARVALRKAPRFLICLLWAAVALRLVLPFSVGGTVQIARTAEPAVSETQAVKADEPLLSETEALKNDELITDKAPDTPVNNIQAVTPSAPIESGNAGLSQDAAELPTEGMTPVQSGQINEPIAVEPTEAPEPEPAGIPARVMGYASAVWVVGMVCMALYALVGYIRLRIKTRVCAEKEKGVWLCDHISSSFIMGVFRPRIMIPSDIHPKEEEYVLLHERSHLARLDHIWKPIAYILLTVYWYDPLVWVAFFLFARDMEYACDERVIRQRGEAVKAPYANALINCAAAPVMPFAGPIAFGEKSVVSRVKNVLNYKKPALWIIIVCAITAAALTVCALLSPVSGDEALIRVAPTDSTEPTEEDDSVAYEVTTRYLVEKSERNVISAQYPVFSGDGYEDINLLIRNYLYAKIDDLCSGDAELIEGDSGGFELDTTAYNGCYLDAEYDIIYHTDSVISIAFDGWFYFRGAAHPNNFFWTLNIDPRTATQISFTDKYTVSEELYDVFAECAKKQLVGTEFEDRSIEQLCPADYFLADLESGEANFYYTKDGVGISCEVSHFDDSHFEVLIPYDDMEAFATDAVGAEIYAQVIADYRAIVSFRRSEDFERLWNEERYFPEVSSVISDAWDDEELGYRLSCMIVEMDEVERSFGYELRDVNGDGVPELFWVNGEGVILAVFTYCDGEAVLLDAFWPRYSCALTDDGNFYGRGSGGAGYTNYEIRRLTAEGFFKVISAFGTDGIDDNYEEVYYEIVDGERVTVSEARFDELYKPFDEIYASYDYYASPAFVNESITYVYLHGYTYEWVGSLNQWRFYNAHGKVVEAGKRWRIPKIVDANDDMVRFTMQEGTGLSTQWGFFYDYEHDRISPKYQWILGQTDTLVALGDVDKVIVRSIFDDSYYVEFTDFEYPIAIVVDGIYSAEFSEDGKSVTVEYVTGKECEIVSMVFELPSDDNNDPDGEEKISSERALELLMDGIEQRGVDYPLYCMDNILTTIDGVECYRIQLSSESSEYLYDENGEPFKMSFTYGYFAVDAHTGKLYELSVGMGHLTEFSYDSEPNKSYDIVIRDTILDGEEVLTSCSCPFSVSKIKNLSELGYWFTVPIINGTEFTKECQIAVKAIDSYQELYDTISEFRFEDDEEENKKMIREYISVYLNHEGFPNHEVVDEQFFEDNIVMIILGDGSLEGINKSGNELSLMFNTTVRYSNDPMPSTVVPHTGESYIFAVYGITRADMLDVDTISIAVKARNTK